MNEDLKSKHEILREVFDHVRKEGQIPWINDGESDEESLVVDQICIHGKSWVSQYLVKDEESDLWEWESSGESEDWCSACDSGCDCGKPHQLFCPMCKTLWPKFSEDRLIEAWKNDEDLVHETNCPKCGHAWSLSMEEMERLHPEELKKQKLEDSSEDEDYRNFAERQDAVVEALHRAYEACPKDGCPADTNYVTLEDGKPCGSGGPIHRCDLEDLMKRFPGQFALETPELSYGPEHDDLPKPVVKKPSPGRNDPCFCGSGKKYKKCCLQ